MLYKKDKHLKQEKKSYQSKCKSKYGEKNLEDFLKIGISNSELVNEINAFAKINLIELI